MNGSHQRDFLYLKATIRYDRGDKGGMNNSIVVLGEIP